MTNPTPINPVLRWFLLAVGRARLLWHASGCRYCLNHYVVPHWLDVREGACTLGVDLVLGEYVDKVRVRLGAPELQFVCRAFEDGTSRVERKGAKRRAA